MSSIINKVKDKLSSDKENPNSANHGSHNSEAANKADPRFDSDLDNRGTYTTGTTGVGNTAHHGSTNAGPHNSNLLNKADPRVDSDLDNRNNPASRTGGYGTQENYGAQGANPLPGSGNQYGTTTGHSGLGSGSGVGGPTGTTGSGYTGSTNAGPHNSNLLNKVDPRVDSDLDNRNNPASRTGGYGTQENYGAQGANPLPSSGNQYGTTTGHSGLGSSGPGAAGVGYSGSSNAGPHNSNLLNKVDPRVDSDLDNRNNPASRTGGYGTQENYGAQGANPLPSSGGQYGTSGHAATTGHHGHQGQTGAGLTSSDQYTSSATPGSGNAASTAGPHNSNLLNKLDPRVDSDLDGSKTVGGNKTHY